MWETSEIKERGKAAFKLNYWKCVIVSILLGLLVGGTTVTVSSNSNAEGEQAVQQMQNAFNGLSSGQQIAVIGTIAGGLSLIVIISILLDIFVFNPLTVGAYSFFKRNVLDPPAELGEIGVGFANYGHTFVTLFLTDLFKTLWTMLFIIPGIVKTYSYRMVPYIIADHPELSPTETITMSRDMMNGNKWHAFCYDLSFIGWYILEILTLGILGVFWVEPYKHSSDAVLYLTLKDSYR